MTIVISTIDNENCFNYREFLEMLAQDMRNIEDLKIKLNKWWLICSQSKLTTRLMTD